MCYVIRTMVARGGMVGMVTSLEALEALDAELCRVALRVGVLRLAMAEGLEALARCGGHHELGFATVEGYALERCERSARWVQGSRSLARRLAGLPAIRRALVRGEIGFCMAQAIAGVARAKDEQLWLEESRRRTVREMRALVRERMNRDAAADVAPATHTDTLPATHTDTLPATHADTLPATHTDALPATHTDTRPDAHTDTDAAARGGQMFAAEDEEPRVTLSVTVNSEDEWLFEHARLLGKHAGTLGSEMLDALLGEGTTSLLAEMDRSSIEPFDETLDERGPQRAWEQELARFRDEAEKRCECRIAARPRMVLGDAQAGELTWDGGAEGMDAQLRRVAAELARRDLVVGELAEGFWKADGWRRLGFATESQYARERLGMSLSAVKAKRALARRGQELSRLHDAVKARELGYEAARLVASVASRETVESWVERARERTVKHLREEVDVAQMLGRLGVDTMMAPPAVTTMEAMAGLERQIVTGEPLQSGESQLFAGVDEGRRHDRDSRGRVVLTFRVGEGTRRYYRWLERTYLRHGPRAGSFFGYLCRAFIGVWQERSRERASYADIYERDLFQCTSPVCLRRALTPHHLVFRSHGGDDSPDNVASLCVWCHLEGVHRGMLTVEPPASKMRWRLGRSGHTVVQNRRRVRVEARVVD
jgi:hypothetical protein